MADGTLLYVYCVAVLTAEQQWKGASRILNFSRQLTIFFVI
jgi:hypothetical protein